MKTLVLSALIAFSASAQDMDVVGSLKVGQMPTDNAANKLVVQKADGKLGTRELNSIASTPDTSRTLGSDLEIFKSFCNCPPETMPPSMVRKLLQSGYSEEDLSLMGVSELQIRRSKPVKDWEGNTYTVMKAPLNEIHYDVYYLKENLRTKYFNDGTLIVGPIPDAGWIQANSLSQAAFAYPNNDDANEEDYGLLYNGHVITTPGKNPCPIGWKPWHVPTVTDIYPGNAETFKSIGNSFWEYPTNGNNNTGFAFPGAGYRDTDGSYKDFQSSTTIWHKDSGLTSGFNAMHIDNLNSNIIFLSLSQGIGASIRCVNDTW